MEGVHDQAAMFYASDEPGLARVKVIVKQRDVVCEAEAPITLTQLSLRTKDHL